MCSEIVKSEIAIFSNPDFGEVRTVMVDGEPWFVAKDVCNILDLGNASKACINLDEDEKGITNCNTPGGEQEMLTISESGLYALVFRSRKPEAKAFSKWVRSDVLPAIRKTGKYVILNSEFPMPKDYASALRLAADMWEAKQKTEGELRVWTQKAIDTHPKVVFANAISGAKGSATVGGLAKYITQGLPMKIGHNRLYRWLHDNGWLMYEGKYRMPTQKAIEKGVLRVRIKRVPVGKYVITEPEVRVTMRGMEYFFSEFRQQFLI